MYFGQWCEYGLSFFSLVPSQSAGRYQSNVFGQELVLCHHKIKYLSRRRVKSVGVSSCSLLNIKTLPS